MVGDIGSAESLQPLLKQHDDEIDLNVKWNLKMALARLGDNTRKKEFASLLDSADAQTRYRALKAAEYIDDKKLSRHLLAALNDKSEMYNVGDPHTELYARVCDAAINLIDEWHKAALTFETGEFKIYSDEEIEEAKQFVESLDESYE